MFKVVVVLKEVAVRLKECEVDIVLRKTKESILLCSKLPLMNGLCLVNLVKEFYLHEDQGKVALQLYLYQPNEKKYGGEIILNVLQWEENVIHSTQTKIVNSPDKHSTIKYEFFYYREGSVVDTQAFLQAKLKRQQEYNLIESSNHQLSEEKHKLEEEVFNWYKKNEQLETGRQSIVTNMNERENYLKTAKGTWLHSINNYSQEFEKEREKREGLARLMGHMQEEARQ